MIRSLAPLGLAAALLALPALAKDRDFDDFKGCSDIGIRFDDAEMARAEEKVSVSGKTHRLTIDPRERGGISVRGWDRGDWDVTVCKVASGDTQAEADALLSRVNATITSDTLRADGPSEDGWTVFFLVRAPKGAELDLEIANGPVSVSDFSGKVSIHAENGPVTARGVSGELDIDASNGPVTLAGNSGRVDVKAQNGPLNLVLDGSRWDGSGLNARAQNGPVTVRVPDGYSSGVKVTASDHSPFRCRAEGCGNVERERGKKVVELGSGHTLVNVSTSNGPVVISNSRS